MLCCVVLSCSCVFVCVCVCKRTIVVALIIMYLQRALWKVFVHNVMSFQRGLSNPTICNAFKKYLNSQKYAADGDLLAIANQTQSSSIAYC
jgi:hypothetical protein